MASTPTTTTAMERHPDIVALRASYEQANETGLAHIADGLCLLAGLYLAISPWVVGFQGLTPLLMVNVFSGLVLVALSFGLATAYGRLHGLAWVYPVVGAFTFVAPWVVRGGVNTTPAVTNNIIIGAACVLLGLVTLLVGRRFRR